MYRQCTTEKTAKQQKLFEETLLADMQIYPYHDITITNLCKKTGLTRNIFYRLFDSKDDVLFALIDNCFMECSHMILNAKNSKDNLLKFFTFWKSKKALLEIIDKNDMSNLLISRGIVCCYRIDFGMQEFIDVDWDNYSQEIFSFFVSGFTGLLYNWYRNDFNRTPEEMVEIAYQLMANPPLRIRL